MTTGIEDPDMEGPENDESYTSRSQLKRDDHARQKIGERLMGLSEDQLGRIGLPDELRNALSFARKIKQHGALRREIRHIGALLRQVDTEPIETALEGFAHGDHEKAYAFKKLEAWRDQLRTGDMTPIEEVLAACPLAERQHLTQLARNARKEFEGEKGVKASKALFRYLKEVSEG